MKLCVFYLVVSSRGAFLQKLVPSLGVAAYLLAFSFFLSFFFDVSFLEAEKLLCYYYY